MTGTEITLPKASDIDYLNTDQVEGYSLYLLKLYEQNGGFRLQRQVTNEMRAIEAELRIWCDTVKDMLMDAPLSDFHVLIASYDLPYRVVYRQAPSESFMRKVRTNAVQRWAKGDKSITSTTVAGILWNEIYSRSFKTLDKKYGLFYFGLVNDWVKELQRTGTFAGISQVETFSRLRILMTEDLFAEYGSKGAEQDKRKWANRHQVKNLANLDTQTLRYYINFSSAASNIRAIPMKAQFEDYIRLYTELNSREDVDKYLHAALNIDIALKEKFLKELN